MSKVLENSPTITTHLETYRFNMLNDTDQKAYQRLCDMLSETRECFNVIAGDKGRNKIVSGPVQLETRHVFENQWNTTDDSKTNPATRVFDWYESIEPNRSIKQGHYLTLSQEMVAIRTDVSKCGYCGSMHWLCHGLTFCDQCLDSEYLEESQLHLLRLRPISEAGDKMPPLSPQEKGKMIHAYIEAQTTANGSRALAAKKKDREDLEKEYKDSLNVAETKYHGFTWLMNKNVNIKNCIYYAHQNSFCFGWKQPVSAKAAEVIQTVLSDFPYSFTIKCHDGKTLEHK